MLKKTFNNYQTRLVLLISLLVNTQQNTSAQCPADPVGANANPFSSTMPDSVFFCEGVNSVIFDPGISNPSVNFTWYKWNGTAWDNHSQNGSNLQRTAGQEGRYAVCWQQLNTGSYKRDEIVLSIKNFSDQLVAEKEFVLPTVPIFTCSDQPVSTFPNAGNPLYDYSWTPATGLSNSRIKNPTITLRLPKGRLSTGDFNYTLTIIDKKNKCKVSKNIPTKTYPILGPEFKIITTPFCQNNPQNIEVRVFMVPGYSIQSSTLTIGTDPVINFAGTAFVKERGSTLLPNTLGQNNIELNRSTDVIDVLRVPVSYPISGSNIPVKFTMVTDKGCIGAVNTTINVNPSPIYTVELDPSNPTKSDFCINDAKIGPLRSSPAAPGTFSGPGVTGDATNGYFFTPQFAGSGNHSIEFTVSTVAGACAGGASIPITVKPAPTPKLVGRANVCPGSFDIEYKDTAMFAAGVTKTWSILNTNGTNAAGITFANFGTPNSIKVAFPNPYTETVKKALIIAENNDRGCIASDTIIVAVNEFEKNPRPVGPTVGCLGINTAMQYKSGSAENPSITYNWKVSQGNIVSAKTDSSLINVAWNATAPTNTRTITVTDVSKKQDGSSCQIQSEALVVNFMNPPIATIKNPVGQSVCAGDTMLVEELNPVAGVVYTWLPGNVIGSSAKLIVPNLSSSFYSYDLNAELPGSTCPVSTYQATFTVKAIPGDPLPQDLLQNCFAEDSLLSITAFFSNTSPPPALGPSAQWLHATDANNPDIYNNTWQTSKPGIYSVQVFDGLTGCSNTGSVEIIDACPNQVFKSFSYNADKAFNSANLYPVPTSDKLYFKLSTDYTSDATYQMIDIIGRVIESGKVNLINGSNLLEFSVGNLETGSYVLKLSSDKNVSNLKFAVSK